MSVMKKTNNLQYDFTIVLYNMENCIEHSIRSIISQEYDLSKVEILFINSEDNIPEIAQKYRKEYPENFFIIDNSDKTINLGLKYSNGKYLNFLNSGDVLSNNTLSEISAFFNKINSLDVAAIRVEESKGKFPIDYGFTQSNKVIDISQHPEFINSISGSFFIKKENINISDVTYIEELLLDSKLGFAIDPKVEKLSLNYMDNETSFEKFINYYENISKFCSEKVGYIPNYIQYKLAIELADIVEIEDIDDVLTNGLTSSDIYDYLNNVFNHINASNIKGNVFINNHTQNFMLYLKNNDFHITIEEDNEVVVYSKNHALNVLNRQDIWMDIIEVKDDFINFSGSITSYCEYDFIAIEALKEMNNKTEVFSCEFVDYSSTERKVKTFLSIPWVYMYNFDVQIPISDCQNCKISFRFTYSDDETEITVNPNIKFRRFASLSAFSHYFIKDSRIVLFTMNSFLIMPYSFKKVLRFELSSIKKILQSNATNKIKTLGYKGIYLTLLPYMKNKKIWLMGDRVEAGDDNAEHLFKYCINQDDDVNKYFIIGKDSPDYNRLKKECKNIVAFRSAKHKILFTFSEKLVSSQVNKFILNPFLASNEFLYNGAVLHDECFIQHGVILHDLSNWIRKYVYNLSLFVTSAEAEWESIAHTNYNFETDRIQLLGLPRYDKLVNNDNKQILFIPTWRRNLDDPRLLVDSEYFKNINNVLNNERLIELAHEYGYSLVFRPHPELWRYLDLFDIPDEFRISEESYTKLFSESSIMITDYSSIAFDFAYLQKPLIYYQTQDFEEFHYEKGYFDYETMGFGEIIKTENDLIDKIEFYLKHNCELEDEYKQRSSKFFKFHDTDNSKRIYEWLINH
ncbi:MAG: CDP-glycerol:glycerophosphate glycerophosphotransferase [Methanobrevibacter sp.]|nr:CDP-glycerol:glycerophosphate glycerophosphotransferase [Methanobrevibacter sp.]